MGMIVVHASFTVQPDHHDAAVDAVMDVVAASREEDGVISYHATTDLEDEHTVRFLERYEDEEAFAAHAQTEHFMAFAGKLPEFLAGEPELLQFDVSDVSDVAL